MKRLIFAWLITAAIVASVFALDGSGTEADPWRIKSLADFNDFTADANYWDDYTRLEADINLVNIDYTAAVIAPDVNNMNWGFQGMAFTGVFDGNSHLISNLAIDTQDASDFYLGLFGKIDSNDAEIKNLGIEDVNIVGGTESRYIGGLCGNNVHGQISNCYSTGSVAGYSHIGGLVGYNGDSMNNIYSTCSVVGNWAVGGLVGAHSGSINNSFSTGLVSSDGDYSGLVEINSGTITNSFWDIETSGQTKSAGGLGKTTIQMRDAATFVGFNDGKWKIDQGNDHPHLVWENVAGQVITTDYPARSYNGSGEESEPFVLQDANDIVCMSKRLPDWGGYFVLANDINMSEVMGYQPVIEFSGSLDGQSFVISNLLVDSENIGTCSQLGLIGTLGGSVTNLGIENVSVNGSHFIGGLAGCNCGSITNCHSTGSVSGCGHLGGLVGINVSSMTKCFSACSVSGDGLYIGGLVGMNYGDIVNNFSSGFVMGIGSFAQYLGGLVGSNYDGSSIDNCYSTSLVSGMHVVGGLVGTNSSEITNSYSTGVVNGHSEVGGLVGANMIYGIINSCYSTGSVSGVRFVGGLVGSNSDSIANSYSKGAVSGDRYVGGLVGDNGGSVLSCYSTGQVEGISDDSEYIGGLVGYTYGDIGSAISSYWDVETSGIGKEWDRNYGAIGRTTAQMKMKIYFPYYHWDFDVEGIWDICDGMNYPKLSWQIPLPGDYVCPDGVDFIDFAILADNWNYSSSQAGYDGNCDLTDDDIVDFSDLRILADNWLEGVE